MDDIKELYKLGKFSSITETINCVEMVFTGHPVVASVGFVLREILEYVSS